MSSEVPEARQAPTAPEARTREQLTTALRSGHSVKYLFFWGHTPRPDGAPSAACFSQWFEGAPFSVDGTGYATAEHWMMAAKARLFGDAEAEAAAVAAGGPGEAKKVGRLVRGFDEDVWVRERFRLVVTGNVAKFEQHPAHSAFLLGTGERVLVEASPRDRIWGIGLGAKNERASDPEQWRGENLLGFALMAARAQLRAAA
jgi:ribA/ribD-fused uncharacterized protein